MQYEIAKELTNKGIVQEIEKKQIALKGTWTQISLVNEPLDRAYFPTLSELIEACGERFGALTQIRIGEWTIDDNNASNNLKGSTPEEVVALLWLSLNKK